MSLDIDSMIICQQPLSSEREFQASAIRRSVGNGESFEITAHIAVTLRGFRIEIGKLGPKEDIAGETEYLDIELTDRRQFVSQGHVAEFEETHVVDTGFGHMRPPFCQLHVVLKFTRR